MARRTPPKTGIIDWIRDVTDVFRPGDRPGETRQAAGFRSTARNVVSTGAAAIDYGVTGGVAGSFGRNVVQPAATVGSPAQRRDAERRGVQQFGRDVAAAAAGYAAGLGLGHGVSAAGKAAAATGIPARVANRVRGEVLLVHGSPTQGIRVVNPTRGPNRGRGTRGVDLGLQSFYGVPSQNPQFGPSQVAMKYALGDQERNVAQNVLGQGSVYLTKAKKADLIFEGGGTIARTPKSSKVVREFRLSEYTRENPQALKDDYADALRRAGGPTIPRSVRRQKKNTGRR